MTEWLLRIEAPHFVAGAIWRKVDGEWRCIDAAPIIRWMVGKDKSIAAYLRKKGWMYQWLK